MNNNDTLFSNNEEELGGMDVPIAPQCTPEERKGYACILLCPGNIVSLSLLVVKGKFKRIKIAGKTGGAAAGKHLLDMTARKGLGRLVQIRDCYKRIA